MKMNSWLHRIRHWLHCQPCEVHAEWIDYHLWVGWRCVVCGEITGVHVVKGQDNE